MKEIKITKEQRDVIFNDAKNIVKRMNKAKSLQQEQIRRTELDVESMLTDKQSEIIRDISLHDNFFIEKPGIGKTSTLKEALENVCGIMPDTIPLQPSIEHLKGGFIDPKLNESMKQEIREINGPKLSGRYGSKGIVDSIHPQHHIAANDYSMNRLNYELKNRDNRFMSLHPFPLKECLVELTNKILSMMTDNILYINKVLDYDFNNYPNIDYLECEDTTVIIASVMYLSKDCDTLDKYINKIYKKFSAMNTKKILRQQLDDIEIDIKSICYNNDIRRTADFINKVENSDKLFVSKYEERMIPLTLQELDSDSRVNYRNTYIKYFGYTQITKLFAYNLAQFIGDKKCLEIMAGKGCLSYALKQYDIDIIPTDNYNWDCQRLNQWLDVEELNCLDAIEKYGKDVDYIIIGWTPYGDPIIEEVFNKIKEVNPDLEIIFIGEDVGGCTGTDDMFDNIEYIRDERFDIVELSYFTWDGLHDRPMLLGVQK